LKSTLELLISYGNHINLYDLNKRTPLFLAAKNNHFEVCKYLLDRGANPFLKSSNGKKAIDICTDDGIKRILKVNMDNISAVNKWIEVTNYHKNVKSFESNLKNQETNENI
jgi:ankyrin repeat protein